MPKSYFSSLVLFLLFLTPLHSQTTSPGFEYWQGIPVEQTPAHGLPQLDNVFIDPDPNERDYWAPSFYTLDPYFTNSPLLPKPGFRSTDNAKLHSMGVDPATLVPEGLDLNIFPKFDISSELKLEPVLSYGAHSLLTRSGILAYGSPKTWSSTMGELVRMIGPLARNRTPLGKIKGETFYTSPNPPYGDVPSSFIGERRAREAVAVEVNTYYINAAGQEVNFSKNASGEWHDDQGVYRLLKANNTSFDYEITTQQGMIFRFRKYKYTLDAAGETMALHYRVEEVVDRGGNTLHITYENSPTQLLLSRISGGGRYIDYFYETSPSTGRKRLKTIKVPALLTDNPETPTTVLDSAITQSYEFRYINQNDNTRLKLSDCGKAGDGKATASNRVKLNPLATVPAFYSNSRGTPRVYLDLSSPAIGPLPNVLDWNRLDSLGVPEGAIYFVKITETNGTRSYKKMFSWRRTAPEIGEAVSNPILYRHQIDAFSNIQGYPDHAEFVLSATPDMIRLEEIPVPVPVPSTTVDEFSCTVEIYPALKVGDLFVSEGFGNRQGLLTNARLLGITDPADILLDPVPNPDPIAPPAVVNFQINENVKLVRQDNLDRIAEIQFPSSGTATGKTGGTQKVMRIYYGDRTLNHQEITKVELYDQTLGEVPYQTTQYHYQQIRSAGYDEDESVNDEFDSCSRGWDFRRGNSADTVRVGLIHQAFQQESDLLRKKEVSYTGQKSIQATYYGGKPRYFLAGRSGRVHWENNTMVRTSECGAVEWSFPAKPFEYTWIIQADGSGVIYDLSPAGLDLSEVLADQYRGNMTFKTYTFDTRFKKMLDHFGWNASSNRSFLTDGYEDAAWFRFLPKYPECTSGSCLRLEDVPKPENLALYPADFRVPNLQELFNYAGSSPLKSLCYKVHIQGFEPVPHYPYGLPSTRFSNRETLKALFGRHYGLSTMTTSPYAISSANFRASLPLLLLETSVYRDPYGTTKEFMGSNPYWLSWVESAFSGELYTNFMLDRNGSRGGFLRIQQSNSSVNSEKWRSYLLFDETQGEKQFIPEGNDGLTYNDEVETIAWSSGGNLNINNKKEPYHSLRKIVKLKPSISYELTELSGLSWNVTTNLVQLPTKTGSNGKPYLPAIGKRFTTGGYLGSSWATHPATGTTLTVVDAFPTYLKKGDFVMIEGMYHLITYLDAPSKTITVKESFLEHKHLALGTGHTKKDPANKFALIIIDTKISNPLAIGDFIVLSSTYHTTYYRITGFSNNGNTAIVDQEVNNHTLPVETVEFRRNQSDNLRFYRLAADYALAGVSSISNPGYKGYDVHGNSSYQESFYHFENMVWDNTPGRELLPKLNEPPAGPDLVSLWPYHELQASDATDAGNNDRTNWKFFGRIKCAYQVTKKPYFHYTSESHPSATQSGAHAFVQKFDYETPTLSWLPTKKTQYYLGQSLPLNPAALQSHGEDQIQTTLYATTLGNTFGKPLEQTDYLFKNPNLKKAQTFKYDTYGRLIQTRQAVIDTTANPAFEYGTQEDLALDGNTGAVMNKTLSAMKFDSAGIAAGLFGTISTKVQNVMYSKLDQLLRPLQTYRKEKIGSQLVLRGPVTEVIYDSPLQTRSLEKKGLEITADQLSLKKEMRNGLLKPTNVTTQAGVDSLTIVETITYDTIGRVQTKTIPNHDPENAAIVEFFYDLRGEEAGHVTTHNSIATISDWSTLLQASTGDLIRYSITQSVLPGSTDLGINLKKQQMNPFNQLVLVEDYRLDGVNANQLDTKILLTGDEGGALYARLASLQLGSTPLSRARYDYDRFDQVYRAQVGTSTIQTRSFQYDQFKRLRLEKHPEMGTVGYGNYNLLGNYEKRTESGAVQRETTMSYNRQGNLTQATYTASGSPTVTEIYGYDYNATYPSLIRTAETQYGSAAKRVLYTYVYDQQLLSSQTMAQNFEVSLPANLQVAYLYDALERRTEITYPASFLGKTTPSKFKYEYGDGQQSRPNTQQLWGILDLNAGRALIDNFQYEGAGGITGYDFALDKGMVQAMPYKWRHELDGMNRPVHWSYLAGSDSLAHFERTYGYDGLSRLTSIQAAYENPTSYAYDALGQLKHAEVGMGLQTVVYDYRYDEFGNLVGRDERKGGVSSTIILPTNAANNRLTANEKNQAVSYSGYGEYLGATVVGLPEYNYDTRGRLQTVRKNATDTATYYYDHRGMRVFTGETVAGVTTNRLYFYDESGMVLGEWEKNANYADWDRSYLYANGKTAVSYERIPAAVTVPGSPPPPSYTGISALSGPVAGSSSQPLFLNTLLSPKEKLAWDDVEGERYELQVANTAGGTLLKSFSKLSVPSANLGLPTGTYSARVRTEGSLWGEWTTIGVDQGPLLQVDFELDNKDLTGLQTSPSLTSATKVAGFSDNGYSLGTTSSLKWNSPQYFPLGSAGRTLMMRVKLSGSANSNVNFLTYGSGSGAFQFGLRGGTLAVSYDGKQLATSAAGALSAGVWYHVAVSYSAGTFVFYLNGNAIHTVTGTAPNTLSGPFTLGAAVLSGFTGIADDVQVFGSALSQADLRSVSGL